MTGDVCVPTNPWLPGSPPVLRSSRPPPAWCAASCSRARGRRGVSAWRLWSFVARLFVRAILAIIRIAHELITDRRHIFSEPCVRIADAAIGDLRLQLVMLVFRQSAMFADHRHTRFLFGLLYGFWQFNTSWQPNCPCLPALKAATVTRSIE